MRLRTKQARGGQGARQESCRVPRSASGVAIIVMATVLALVVLPIVGVFVFELNRYQFTMQAVSKACDAAALAGGAKLVSAETDFANPNAALRREQKQRQARAAVIDFMRKQRILGIGLDNALEVVPIGGVLTASGLDANKCRINVFPADPANNYAAVAFGSPLGRAIKVEAIFNEVPSFLSHMGFDKVPVFASATSGMPRIEVIICLDLSGSMDDCTRVSLVKKVLNLTPQGRQEYNNLPPQPTPPSDADITKACGDKPDPCLAEDPACQQWLQCEQQQCNQFNQEWNNWLNQFNSATGPNKRFIDYQVVADGQLRKIFDNPVGYIPPAGTQINALPHRHLTYTKPPYTAKNYPYQWQGQGTIGPCTGGSGFTDLIVNLDPRIAKDAPTPEQPILNNYPFIGFSEVDKYGFQYRNLAEITEAARGTASAKDAWGPFAATTASEWNSKGGVSFGGQQAKEAYEKDSLPYMQPVATVIDASKAFIDALADSGRAIKCGIVGYEELVPDPPPPDDPNTPQFENQSLLPVKSDDPSEPDRQVPLVGLVPLDQEPAVNLLKERLDSMFSLRKTDMTVALQRSTDILKASASASNARSVKRIIVLFTDGMNTGADPLPVATDCKNNGIAIYTIGLAQSAQIQTQMANLLNSITNEAGNGGIFLSAPTAKEVRKTFLTLARRLVKLQQ